MSLSPAVRQILAGLPASDLAKLPDADLLAQYAGKHDEAAFAVLVGRHGPAVLGVCRRTLGHLQDTEDAAQAVFLVLARNARRVRKPEALSAWLHGVAVRVSRKSLVKRRKVEPLPEEAPAAQLSDPTWADARRVIDEALAALPESLRVPLVLCYIEGLTRDEAANRLSIPLDTFRGRLERGREKLRAALAKRGFPLSTGLLAVLLDSPASASAAWVKATATLATGNVPIPKVITSLTNGVLPMSLPRLWLVGTACAAIAFGSALWAAGTGPDTRPPAPNRAAATAAEEPQPLLPKDRKCVWRAVVVSPDGNRVERHAIRFLSDTELVWTAYVRSPGVDSRSGVRYKYTATATGKLLLDRLADLQADGLEWNPRPGNVRKIPPVEYTVIPLDKNVSSFQLVRTNARGVKLMDAVFRNEADPPRPADPLVPGSLAKIDRTIKKQPKYTHEPKYALVAFGPDAEFKVWVAIDGDVVYIDRNGNGDLTEPGERKELRDLEENAVRQSWVDLTYRLPGTKKTDLNVWWFHSPQARTGGFLGAGNEKHISQTAGGNELNYAPSPEQAAVIHFGSQVVTIRLSLTTSVERQWRHAVPDANGEAQVLFQVGTPGVGVGAGHKDDAAGSFAAFMHTDASTRGDPPLVPKGTGPVAEFEFTALNPAEKPKKVTVMLTDRVGQTEFGGKITVPDGVKTGLDAAKVTLRFPNCPWGKVEPVTLTMDVIPKN